MDAIMTSGSPVDTDIYAGTLFVSDFEENFGGTVISHVTGVNSFALFADALAQSAAVDGGNLYLYTDLGVAADLAVTVDTQLTLGLGGGAVSATVDFANHDWTVTRGVNAAGLVIDSGVHVTNVGDFSGVGYGHLIFTGQSILTIRANGSMSAQSFVTSNENYARVTVAGTLTVAGLLDANAAISVAATGAVTAGTFSVDGIASDIAAGGTVTVGTAMYLNRLNLYGSISAPTSSFYNQLVIMAGASLSAGQISFGSSGVWKINYDQSSSITYSGIAGGKATLSITAAADFAGDLVRVIAQTGSGTELDYNNTNVTISGVSPVWYIFHHGNLYLSTDSSCDRSEIVYNEAWQSLGSFGKTVTLADNTTYRYGVNAIGSLSSAFMAVSVAAGATGQLTMQSDYSFTGAKSLISKSAGTITVVADQHETITGGGNLTVSVGGTVRFEDQISINLGAYSLSVTGGNAIFEGTISVGGNLTVSSGAALALHDQVTMAGGSVSNQGSINLDIAGRQAADNALIYNLGSYSGSGALSVSVGVRQLSGVYHLISGVSSFTLAVTVYDVASHSLGAVAVGQSVTDAGGRQYTLNLTGNQLVLTVAGDDLAPVLAGLPQAAVDPDGSVTVSWDAATDNVGVTGYKMIIDDGDAIDVGNLLSYGAGVLSLGRHDCRIAAYDLAGNLSGYSERQSFTVYDGIAPAVPSGLVAQVSGSSVALDWQDAADNVGTTSYYLRYGTVADLTGDGAALSASSDLLQNLAYGKYYWQVSAADAAGNSSNWSTVSEFQVKTIALPYVFPGQITGPSLVRLGEFELAAGKYSFSGTFAANAKVMLYDVKNANKILAAATVDKAGNLVWKSPLLLSAGTYELGVISADKGKTAGAFTVTAAGEVFNRANLVSDDNWQDAGLASVGYGSTVSDWVGFGDKIDCRKLDIAVSGTYNFDLSGLQNALKLTVYTVNAKGTLQKVKSITVSPKFDKSGNIISGGTGALNGLLLTATQPYYLAVEATKAAKGANSEYVLDIGGTRFDNINNNVANNNWSDAGVAALDLVNGLSGEWVGYGDAVDFYQFELTGGAAKSCRFTLDAAVDKSAVMTIYQLTQKNGVDVLKQLKADKNGYLYLSDGEYAVKIASADNGRGLKNTDYSIAVTLA